MCEIVVLDPNRTENIGIHQLAVSLTEEQGDGFGILAVKSEGGKFTYDTYRSTNPDWMALHEFLERNNEEAWRYVLHGRAKTTGEVKHNNTHPLPIDCPECEGKWIVHNGSVRGHQQVRGGLMSAGHQFATDVDSENIAHKIPELPDKDLGEMSHNEHKINGTLNYLVFYEDGIFARLSQKYHITGDFVVSCRTRKREEPMVAYEDWDKLDKWFRVTPTEDGGVTVEKSKQKYTGRNKYGAYTAGAGTNRDTEQTQLPADPDATIEPGEGAVIVEEYQDLVPDIEQVVAYQVAPDVVKVVEKVSYHHFFIYEDEHPQAFEWYVDDAKRSASTADPDDGEGTPGLGDPEDGGEAIATLFDENGNAKDPEDIASRPRNALAAHLVTHEDPEIREAAQELAEEAIANAVPEDGEVDPVALDELLTDEGALAEDDDDPLGQMRDDDIQFRAFMELKSHYNSTQQALRELEKMDDHTMKEVARANVKLESLAQQVN